jgi:glutathione synthase/RimK-type ligase-like ATP-grasp enzyme
LRYLLIEREQIYSPGRSQDDLAILSRIQQLLIQKGIQTVSISGESFLERKVQDKFDVALAMCRNPKSLRLLDEFIAQNIRVFNDPESIRHCSFRVNMLSVLSQSQINIPLSQVISTLSKITPEPWPIDGVWLKRCDFHSLESQDVVLISDITLFNRMLDEFRNRGHDYIIVQRHVRGPTIKCYSVGGDRFLRCYPALERQEHQALVKQIVQLISQVFGLEIFGVDIILDPEGSIVIVDVNDWPSFAPCLDEAANAIVNYTMMAYHKQ